MATNKRGRPGIGPEVKTRLPEELVAEIDAAAAEGGPARAEVIRDLVQTSVRHGLQLDNREPAYLLGRLFATLDEIQDATGESRTLFYGKFAPAIEDPGITLTAGLPLAKKWLGKLARLNTVRVPRWQAELDELVRLINPPVASTPESGLARTDHQQWFILGYWHQKSYSRRMRGGDIPDLAGED